MITGWGSFFFYLFILAIVGLSWGLGLDADIAFLIVGGATALLMYWFFIRERPGKTSPADGNARLADRDELKSAGLSHDT
jgi:hypothetical protein